MDEGYLLLLGWADLPEGVSGLLLAISMAITEVEIAQQRIREGSERLRAQEQMSYVPERQDAKRYLEEDRVYERLMADIHLYLVAWTNIGKTLRTLRGVLNDPKLDWIQNRRHRWFDIVRRARNSLEHLDDRALRAGKNRTMTPIAQVRLARTSVYVYGVRVEISEASFRRIEALKNDLTRWYSRLPTIFDAFDSKHGEPG